MSPTAAKPYRGRLAPSPTGWLHLGHGRTFWLAARFARRARGTLILRNDDLDQARCRPEYVTGMLEDLRWLGLTWQEGPDGGGPCAPYDQSRRLAHYRAAFERLRAAGLLYPCTCSRRDIRLAASAPHPEDDEPIYPGTCRERLANRPPTRPHAWRFRVTPGQEVAFHDHWQGPQRFVAGRDFGDFVVWRQDDLPAYHLACAVDEALMGITEVVRGADLLRSTARQILLFRALGWPEPGWCHCPLVVDANGRRLAKRHDAMSLRTLRAQGVKPKELWARWNKELLRALGVSKPTDGARERT